MPFIDTLSQTQSVKIMSVKINGKGCKDFYDSTTLLFLAKYTVSLKNILHFQSHECLIKLNYNLIIRNEKMSK